MAASKALADWSSIGSAFAIYFVVWWVVLFMMLPIGVKSQHEAGAVTDGTDPGAPVRPMLAKKALWTTLVATIVFALIWWGADYILNA